MPGDINDELLSALETIAAQVQQQRISSWLAFSAHSPNNLRFLPQPTPNGLHTPLSTCYTFHEETRLARILGQLTLPGPANFFHSGRGSLWAALQELDELHDPWLRRARDAGAHNDDGDGLGDANTEDELYRAFSPRLSRSWPGVALPWERTMGQRLRYGTGEPSEREPSNSTVTETVVSLNGNRIITRTTLRSNGGITERCVATERRDARGLVTERTTHVARVLSDCSGPSIKNQDIVAEGCRPADTTGWFWARSS